MAWTDITKNPESLEASGFMVFCAVKQFLAANKAITDHMNGKLLGKVCQKLSEIASSPSSTKPEKAFIGQTGQNKAIRGQK